MSAYVIPSWAVTLKRVIARLPERSVRVTAYHHRDCLSRNEAGRACSCGSE